jgi:hypothetical protein
MREKIRSLSTLRTYKSPTLILFVCGVLVFILSGWLWWAQVYQNPERVYWSMLANSLQTTSVTRQLSQNSTASKLSQTVVQTFGVSPTVQSYTTLQQGKSTIKTENIGTPDKDYIRYIAITSDQKSTAGKALNFAPALNKWAQTDVPNTAGAQNPSLFTQVTLGLAGGNLVPQAELQATDRDKLLTLLRNTVVFDTNLDNVKKQRVAGRLQYVYTSNVQAVGYVGFQKEFAKMVGLKLLDKVDPNDYQGQAATKVELTVDAWSHQLVSVNYIGQDRKEQYSSYGVVRQVPPPVAKLTGTQLQQLVNKVE